MKVYVYVIMWPFEPGTADDVVRVFTSSAKWPEPVLPAGKEGYWDREPGTNVWRWYSDHRPGFVEPDKWGATEHLVCERELDGWEL